MPRRLAPLVLILAGCFADSGHVSSETGAGTSSGSADTSGTTTGDLPTATGDPTVATTTGTGGGETSDTGGEAGTQTTATSGTATATSTTTTTATATTVETTAPPANCGDGVVDGDEQCDDGNGSNDDNCLADCTLANCSDGYLNNGESDVDCGGPCDACGGCGVCGSNDDCGFGTICLDQRCRAGADVVIDWVKDCSKETQGWADGPDLPAGAYRITALGGGGSAFDDPPSYQWTAGCEGLDFGTMGTAAGYASAMEAFDALPVTEVTSDYPGGPLRCGILDTFCLDNLGSESFSVWQECN